MSNLAVLAEEAGGSGWDGFFIWDPLISGDFVLHSGWYPRIDNGRLWSK